MLEQVHQHIVSELQQSSRTDTIFVVTAVVFNLIVLGINSAVADTAESNGGDAASDVILGVFIAMSLLVNAIADGMNLVAKEGPVINQRDGVLILSEAAGARQQLESAATVISPYDVYTTAEALHEALVMPIEERRDRASRLRWLVEREDINDWLCRQLGAVVELNM